MGREYCFFENALSVLAQRNMKVRKIFFFNNVFFCVCVNHGSVELVRIQEQSFSTKDLGANETINTPCSWKSFLSSNHRRVKAMHQDRGVQSKGMGGEQKGSRYF